MRTRQQQSRYFDNQCRQCYIDHAPPVPLVRPKFIDWPRSILAVTALVYAVFVVECVAWGVRWLWRSLN